jgi:Gas vesicle protein
VETTRDEGALLGAREQISLCEMLDRVLNKGVVVAGEVVISVAGIDLVYLGLQLVLTSVETARRNHIGVWRAEAVGGGA